MAQGMQMRGQKRLLEVKWGALVFAQWLAGRQYRKEDLPVQAEGALRWWSLCRWTAIQRRGPRRIGKEIRRDKVEWFLQQRLQARRIGPPKTKGIEKM